MYPTLLSWSISRSIAFAQSLAAFLVENVLQRFTPALRTSTRNLLPIFTGPAMVVSVFGLVSKFDQPRITRITIRSARGLASMRHSASDSNTYVPTH
jgi:hypothetical protein